MAVEYCVSFLQISCHMVPPHTPALWIVPFFHLLPVGQMGYGPCFLPKVFWGRPDPVLSMEKNGLSREKWTAKEAGQQPIADAITAGSTRFVEGDAATAGGIPAGSGISSVMLGTGIMLADCF